VVSGTTASTSSTTGSITAGGGVGVAGALYVGTLLVVGTPGAIVSDSVFATYGTTDATSAVGITKAVASAAGGEIRIRKSRGTIASPTQCLSGDNLGRIMFEGYHSSGAFGQNTGIRFNATENWTVGAQGSSLNFLLTPTGTTSQNTAFTFSTTTTADTILANTALVLQAGSSGASLTLATGGGATLSGALTTSAPSGGTAGAWKLGILVTAANVFDTSRYIQLDVGGTLYKVAVGT